MDRPNLDGLEKAVAIVLTVAAILLIGLGVLIGKYL